MESPIWNAEDISAIEHTFLRDRDDRRSSVDRTRSFQEDHGIDHKNLSIRGARDETTFTDLDLAQISQVINVNHDIQRSGHAVDGPQPPSQSHLRRQDIVLQRRPGTRHGKGGRSRGTSRRETMPQVSQRVGSVALKAFTSYLDDSVSILVDRLRHFVMKLLPEGSNWVLDSAYEASLRKDLTAIKIKAPKSYTILNAPVLCVTTNVGTTNSRGVPDGNIKDRYAASIWLDPNGSMHCTCFGSTKHRILKPLFESWEVKEEHFCVHMRGLLLLIDAVSVRMEVSQKLAAKALSHLYACLRPVTYAEYVLRMPTLHVTHETRGKATVTVLAELGNRNRSLSFVPIRTVRKSVKRNVCLFCDNTGRGTCHHLRSFAILHEDESEMSETFIPQSTSTDSVSELPLGPVNCKRSLEVDTAVCEKARKGEPFLALAPLRCTRADCSGERLEKSRQVHSDGVIMCTVGPCFFHYEYFKCSVCSAQIGAEGRDLCIVIERVTSAATHAFIRRELIGVALSIGTLTGRLKHYHSQVTAEQYFGMLPAAPRCLSITTLRTLCTVMLKLMSSCPLPELFTCRTCEFDNGERRYRLRALCMDGINQGYLRRCQREFKNISEKCLSLPCPRRKPLPSNGDRPLDNIMRFKSMVEVALNAIVGNSLNCNERRMSDFIGAVQLVADDVIPLEYCTESICSGCTAEHIEGIMVTATVSYIRALLSSLFQTEVILSRLLQPMLSTFNTSEKYTTAFRTSVRERTEMLPPPDMIRGKEVYWSPKILSIRDRFVTKDLLRLLKMILQGPATQIIPKSALKSMRRLADMCCYDRGNTIMQPEFEPISLLKLLQEPHILIKDLPGHEHEETNILDISLILQAGLKSISEIEEADLELGKTIRNGFGVLFAECADVVELFYSFYAANSGTESAVMYRDEWSSTNAMELRQKLLEKYPNHIALKGSILDIAINTGFYFPAHPQIRPLAFNVEESAHRGSHLSEEDRYCSKDFLDNDRRYTPCCLTFVCSCFHPIILGFKSTQSAEGTKIILDSILSRFAVLPEYLIYDYSCGLYNSARHALWWAIENTTVVTDFFHSKNHCCSPGYEPGAHLVMHNMNTVAHEQRNRAIKELSKSLRNSSQEFYLSLLGYQCVVRNIQAKSLAAPLFAQRPSLVSEYDVEWCFFECLKLSCLCCNASGSGQ